MSRPQPGDPVRRYLCLWRADLWRGPRGWWLTIWRTRPPAPGQPYRSVRDRWHLGDRVRVIHEASAPGLGGPPRR